MNEINQHKTTIFKIGGSILKNLEDLSHTISQLKELFKNNFFENLIIITGGGSYANFIRFADLKLNLGEELSHWLAILAMDFNARKLHEKYNLKLIDNFEELQKLVKNVRQMLIFAPFNYLFTKD
ncbi:MAG: amino acid kinase family protein, partial [Promethearchaeota archaeon]